MKGVAAENSSDGKPTPFKGPMFFDRLQGVFGAGGEKATAVAHEGADGGLIEADEEEKK